MIVTIHRREHILYGPLPGYCYARWIDYAFDPLPAADRPAPRGFRVMQHALPPQSIEIPGQVRLFDRQIPDGRTVRRLAVHHDPAGIDAETAFRLAVLEQRRFTMSSRKKPEGPSLFGDDQADPDPGASAYPRPSSPPAVPPPPPAPRADRDRAELVAIARKVVDEHHAALVARVRSLETAVRRALEQLDADRWTTARAILECALDESPAETAQAKSA